MKKKFFGKRLSSIAGYLRNFIRQIKLIRKGNYFITNDKSYVDDGLATNHVTDFLYDEKFMNKLNKSGIKLDRKVLADIAYNNPEKFKSIVKKVQSSLN